MSNRPLYATIPIFLVSLFLFMAIVGCGGGSTGQGALPGTVAQTSSSSEAAAGGHLVGVWKVNVDVAGEKMTFTPVDPAEAGIAGNQSRFQIEDANVALTGSATWASPTLSGNVTMTNNSGGTLYFPMVMVTQISDGSVTVANEDFNNGPNPTWKYDNLAAGGTFPVEWQFSDPGGVDFTFYVHVFAWASQISGTGNALMAVQFCDANTGIAVGNSGTIIHTVDGGTTWNAALSVPSAVPLLYGVDMADGNIAWAVGSGDTIWKTIDGGVNWVDNNPPPLGVSYTAVVCLDANHAVAVGTSGTIVYTADGGNNWFPASLVPDASNLVGLSMIDVNTGWACGDNGAIWTTADGGDTWIPQNSGYPAYAIASISFIDANNGTAVSQGKILHTVNGGTNWTSAYTGSTNMLFKCVRQITTNEAWVVGGDASGGTPFMIYHVDYTNGSTVGTTTGTTYLYGLAFGGDPTTGDGWAVGTGGLLLH